MEAETPTASLKIAHGGLFAELVSSLREVQWNQSPRPVSEVCSLRLLLTYSLWQDANHVKLMYIVQFVSGFAPAQQGTKLQGRVKCNVYYYRTNYLLYTGLLLSAALYRHLTSLPALSLCFLGFLCLNDTFATAVR